MLCTNATALAFTQILKRVSGEFAIVSKAFHIEIHRAVAGHIRVVALNRVQMARGVGISFGDSQ